MALTDNIVAYWKLDNDGSDGVSLVDSTSGSTLTNSGGVTLGTGVIFGDAVFDGASKLTTTSSLDLSGDLTISFWSKITGGAFLTRDDGSGGGGLDLYPLGNLFAVSYGSTWLVQGASTANFTEWNHYAVTRSGDLWTAYVNGSQVGPTGTDSVDLSGTYCLGGADSALNGEIDEFGFWNRGLSSTEVTLLYNGGSGKSYPFTPALTDNIAAYWKLDDNGSGGVSLVDSTSGGHTLTNINGVALGTGKILGCGDLSYANNSRFSITPATGLALGSGGFAISGWFNSANINPNGTGGYPTLICIGNWSAGVGNGMAFRPNNSGTGFQLLMPTSIYNIPYTISTGAWYHYCVTRNSGVIQVYINGVSEFSTADTSDQSDASSLLLGNRIGNEYEENWDGLLDETGIWNRGLSSTEVTELYNGGSGKSYPFIQPALTDNILAYWKLDNNGSGGVSLVDSTSGGHTFTNNNGAALGVGKLGSGSVSLTGTEWLSNSSFPAPSTGDFSVSFWAYVNNFSGYQTLASTRSAESHTSPSAYSITTTAGGYIVVYSGTFIIADNIVAIPAETWTHVTVTRASGVCTVYINGNSAATGAWPNDLTQTLFQVGSNEGAFEFLNGRVDEVGVWSRVLSSTEVTALYNSGLGLSYPFGQGPTSPLYYNNAESDGDWGNLLNWWVDSGFTLQSITLPTATNPVSIYGDVLENTDGVCYAASAEFYSSSFYTPLILDTTGAVNVQGTGGVFDGTCMASITFHDTCSLGENGITFANATFRDSSTNSGTVQGNAFFYESSYNYGLIGYNATVYYSGGDGSYPIGGLVAGVVTYLGWPAVTQQYFNDQVAGSGAGGNWQDKNNWWTDDTFTTRPINAQGSQELPDVGTSIYVYGTGLRTSTSISTISVNNAEFHANSYLIALTLNVSVNAKFYGNSGIEGVVYGTCYFYENSYWYSNNGLGFIYGNAYLYDNSGVYQEWNKTNQLASGVIYMNSLNALKNSFGFKYEGLSDGVVYNIPSSGGGDGGNAMISRLLNLPWFINV